MKESKRVLISFFCVMLIAFFAIKATPTFANTADAGISLAEMIELFISLEIIPNDKADKARGIVKEKMTEVQNKVANQYCVALTKNLYMGATDATTDGEVSKLQKFLKEAGDFTHPEITGYYGPATEIAVQKWQTKMKIVTSGTPDTTGFGAVGPMTRTKMLCAKVDEPKTEESKVEEKDADSTVTKISLYVNDSKDKVYWTTKGTSTLGYKIVWSRDESPKYPTRDGDKSVYETGIADGSRVLNAFDGTGTYYVRVCEYINGGECGTYSNEVSLSITSDVDTEEGGVVEIELTVDDEDEGTISWVTDGYSQLGYKVVWSLNTGPTYPTRANDTYLYFDDPDTDSATLEAFKGPGRYHVRVCEYLGGKCGVYSDEEVIEF
jgi:peptidoglycan hydrolase-like protein with peptidoglycan-binding domain